MNGANTCPSSVTHPALCWSQDIGCHVAPSGVPHLWLLLAFNSEPTSLLLVHWSQWTSSGRQLTARDPWIFGRSTAKCWSYSGQVGENLSAGLTAQERSKDWSYSAECCWGCDCCACCRAVSYWGQDVMPNVAWVPKSHCVPLIILIDFIIFSRDLVDLKWFPSSCLHIPGFYPQVWLPCNSQLKHGYNIPCPSFHVIISSVSRWRLVTSGVP